MTDYRYLCLLRGINVGGNNIIRMTDLRKCFEEMGFENVLTYIQSGNVIFNSQDNDPGLIAGKIRKALSERFEYNSMNIVISRQIFNQIMKEAPEGFGGNPEKYRYDVIFFNERVKPEDVINELKPRPEVDEAYSGTYSLYFQRLITRASQSRLSKLMSLPVYKHLSIRNWNTTSKLHELINS